MEFNKINVFTQNAAALNKAQNKEVAKEEEKQTEVKDSINDLTVCLKSNEEPRISLGMHCFKPYDCPFFKHCSNFLPENNVFNVRKMWTKEKVSWFEKGIYSYENLLKEDLKPRFKDK